MTGTAQKEFFLACCGAIMVLGLLVTHAMVYSGIVGTRAVVLLTVATSIGLWAALGLWFRQFSPVIAPAASACFVLSYVVKAFLDWSLWDDALSFHSRDGAWGLGQCLGIVAFALLAYAVWRSAEVPIFVPIVLGLYCVVSIIKVVLGPNMDLPAYSTLVFLRNLFGGLSYVSMGVYFVFAAMARREAMRAG